jgi:hypothetical protein
MDTPDITTTETGPRVYGAVLGAAALAAIAVTIVVGLGSQSRWVGSTFPGFFVLPNRVIPSVGRMSWSGTQDGVIFQRTVTEIGGAPIKTNADAYQVVASQRDGAPVRYTLRSGAATDVVELETRTFTRGDFWVIFGGYLATGLVYLLVGLGAAWLFPNGALGRALLLVGGIGGIYALSGAGIYSPDADLRIHTLAEAFFPATLVYLTLVLGRVPRAIALPAISVAWWLALALAVSYQLVLGQPGAYSMVHAACETYLGLAGLGAGIVLIVARAKAGAGADVMLRSALAGALLGLGLPAVLFTLSGLSGGAVPVNLCTATAFLFPSMLALGVVRERLAVRRQYFGATG